jgi:predicted phosphodiesterase
MKLIFPTDEHHPFQDNRALSVAHQIAQDFNPDLRIAGSDGMDFYSISRFDKNPERLSEFRLQEEINSWIRGQKDWRSATPHAKAFFLKGNHEDRWRRLLWSNPNIAGLDVLQLPHLLRLKELDIFWEKDKGLNGNTELNLYGKLLLKHGEIVRKFSGYSAKAELEKEMHAISVIHGHTHRGGTYYVTTRSGVVTAQEGFCLCNLEPEYVQHPNWQQGMVVAEVEPDYVNIEPIPFRRLKGKVTARWRGKEYVEA